MVSAISKPRTGGEEQPPSLIAAFFRGTDFGGYLLWRGANRDPAGSMKRVVRDPAIQERIASDPDRLRAYQELSDSVLVLPSLRLAGIANDVHWRAAMPEIPLATIRVPTLVVHGDKDDRVELEQAQYVVEKVPGAELVKIAGGDHFIGVSHPVETFGPMFKLLERIAKEQEVAQLAAQGLPDPMAAGAAAPAAEPKAAAAAAPAAAK